MPNTPAGIQDLNVSHTQRLVVIPVKHGHQQPHSTTWHVSFPCCNGEQPRSTGNMSYQLHQQKTDVRSSTSGNFRLGTFIRGSQVNLLILCLQLLLEQKGPVRKSSPQTAQRSLCHAALARPACLSVDLGTWTMHRTHPWSHSRYLDSTDRAGQETNAEPQAGQPQGLRWRMDAPAEPRDQPTKVAWKEGLSSGTGWACSPYAD